MTPAEPHQRINRSSSVEQISSRDPSHSSEDCADGKNGNGMKNWYMRSWPGRPKAPAVTEIARESISASAPIGPERNSSTSSLASSHSLRSPTIGLLKKGISSTRSLPADAATTRINIASTRSASVPKMTKEPMKLISNNSTHDPKPEGDENKREAELEPHREVEAEETQDNKERVKEGSEGTADTSTSEPTQEELHESDQPQASAWSSWFFGHRGDPPKPEDKSQPDTSVVPETQQQTEQPDDPLKAKPEHNVPGQQVGQENSVSDKAITETSVAQRLSWLQLLTGSGNMPSDDKPTEAPTAAQETPQPVESTVEPAEPQEAIDTQAKGKENDGSQYQEAQKSSPGWIFWSRERLGQNAVPKDDQLSQENILYDTPKQEKSAPGTEAVETQETRSDTIKKTKKAVAQGPSTAPAQHDIQEPRLSTEPTTTKQPPPSASRKTQRTPNQLLPSLKSTFSAQEKPGLLQQINRWLHADRSPESRHVSLSHEVPRLKKALAIGIHGYFPAPLLRTVLGQPTGTSVRFSAQAAKAIADWADLHGCRCEVQKIALEGEGHIEERVNLLWRLLLNWIEHIRTADFVLIACHSQGVPVATMLAAKLISFGCVNSARIGICAMAGVNIGPFPDFKSRWISGSAGELFDFADPKSKVSQDLTAALKIILDFGVRITYVGSIDDQLVSLESSTFATISHPYIYRAVFVDGRVHAPGFLSQLVGFAMKLRNLGISDHGLIRELSAPLAGSLYTGEGHSRLYDDETVYQLAIEFTLETTSVPRATLEVQNQSRSSAPNPFILPFAMRGVLEEEYVRRELSAETTSLLQQFEEWKPSSKVLKDVKFRLEGIRSKL